MSGLRALRRSRCTPGPGAILLLIVAVLGASCRDASISSEAGLESEPPARRGVEKEAQRYLRGAAELLLGARTYLVRREPNSDDWEAIYSLSSCPPKSADPAALARRRQEDERAIEGLLPTLISLADKDRSGEVTLAEARRLERAVRFGWEARAFGPAERWKVGRLAELLRLTEPQVRELIADYFEICARLGARSDLRLPRLDESLRRAAS